MKVVKSNIAIIPIRMGSKRLPRKNVRPFFGKPIFVYTLEYARICGLFDEIIVSTESEEVRDICLEQGLKLPFMRPEELASDTAQLTKVIEHVLEEYERRGQTFDNFCILWATAPMRTDKDILDAYKLLGSDTEAVVGVSNYDLPVFCALRENEEGFMVPLFEEYQKLPSSQQPSVVVDNSTVCWVRVSAFFQHRTWLPPKLKGYWMPRHHSVDIDNEEDWELSEFYYKRYLLKKE